MKQEQEAKVHVKGLGWVRPKPGYGWYDGKVLKVVDNSRYGWWRFHEHYDRDGYCDNPGRGY